MNILEIIYYSWLNRFLYTNTSLVKSVLEMDKFYIIQLDLTIKEISFIKNNFEEYVKILENILYTYNQSSNKYFKNITFNAVIKDNIVYNNCIFLYNCKTDEVWFIKTLNYIKISNKKKKINLKTIYDKIIDLIYKKDLSVRNLIKLWIIQIRAREIYNFLKEKEVFIISEYNNNSKRYIFDNIKNFSKNDIDDILHSGV